MVKFLEDVGVVQFRCVVYRVMQTISQFLEASPCGTAAALKTSKDRRWSIFLLLLGILGLVLTNGYKGVVTENVIAPLITDPPQNADDLINNNFTLYSVQTKAHNLLTMLIPRSMKEYVPSKDVYISWDNGLIGWFVSHGMEVLVVKI